MSVALCGHDKNGTEDPCRPPPSTPLRHGLATGSVGETSTEGHAASRWSAFTHAAAANGGRTEQAPLLFHRPCGDSGPAVTQASRPRHGSVTAAQRDGQDCEPRSASPGRKSAERSPLPYSCVYYILVLHTSCMTVAMSNQSHLEV